MRVSESRLFTAFCLSLVNFLVFLTKALIIRKDQCAVLTCSKLKAITIVIT